MTTEEDSLKIITRDIFLKAHQSEHSGRVLEATDLFEEGIEKLKNLMLKEKRPTKLEVYTKHLNDHIAHVQEFRSQFDYHNRHGKLIDEINILDGSRYNSYQNIFGKYLTHDVREILIYEPQFSKYEDMKNLIHFIEVLLKRCYNLRYIRFITRTVGRNQINQLPTLNRLQFSLATKNINFKFRFNEVLTEHMIVLNNGYIIKSSRGINYFYDPEKVLDLGIGDLDFRRCLKTSIKVWATTPFIEKIG